MLELSVREWQTKRTNNSLQQPSHKQLPNCVRPKQNSRVLFCQGAVQEIPAHHLRVFHARPVREGAVLRAARAHPRLAGTHWSLPGGPLSLEGTLWWMSSICMFLPELQSFYTGKWPYKCQLPVACFWRRMPPCCGVNFTALEGHRPRPRQHM